MALDYVTPKDVKDVVWYRQLDAAEAAAVVPNAPPLYVVASDFPDSSTNAKRFACVPIEMVRTFIEQGGSYYWNFRGSSREPYFDFDRVSNGTTPEKLCWEVHLWFPFHQGISVFQSSPKADNKPPKFHVHVKCAEVDITTLAAIAGFIGADRAPYMSRQCFRLPGSYKASKDPTYAKTLVYWHPRFEPVDVLTMSKSALVTIRFTDNQNTPTSEHVQQHASIRFNHRTSDLSRPSRPNQIERDTVATWRQSRCPNGMFWCPVSNSHHRNTRCKVRQLERRFGVNCFHSRCGSGSTGVTVENWKCPECALKGHDNATH